MFWAIVIGQALISAILCGIIADSKGRDVGGWAILGFLFGLFALIAAVGVPPLTKSSQPEEAKLDELKPAEAVAFSGERALSNDAYKLWLAANYAIKRNELFDSFVLGDRIFPELEEALAYAHSQELEAIAAAEAAAIAKAEAEELERQMREQQMAQAAAKAAEDRRRFWRGEVWIVAALPILGGGAFFAVLVYLNKNNVDQINQKISNRIAVEKTLDSFGLPLIDESSDHQPEADLPALCSGLSNKNRRVLSFVTTSVAGNVDYIYSEAAREKGYEKSPSLYGWVYRHSDGRMFKVNAVREADETEVSLCLVDDRAPSSG